MTKTQTSIQIQPTNSPVTNNPWLTDVIQANTCYQNCWVPMCTYSWRDFSNRIMADLNKFPTLYDFIKKETFANKHAIFEELGFRVDYLTLSPDKAINFVCQNGFELDFVNQRRNTFMIEVTGSTQTLVFVLSYHDRENPLSLLTIDAPISTAI